MTTPADVVLDAVRHEVDRDDPDDDDARLARLHDAVNRIETMLPYRARAHRNPQPVHGGPMTTATINDAALVGCLIRVAAEAAAWAATVPTEPST